MERGRQANPFPIAVFVLLVRGGEVHAVETAHRQREDELDEAEDGVCDVRGRHSEVAQEAHVC